MTTIINNAYLTVAELLELPICKNFKLVAGNKGLNNTISGFNLSDTPKYYDYLSPNEMLITSCYSIYQNSDEIASFIPNIREKNLSCVLIKPSYFLASIPNIMIQQANKYNIPLIELPSPSNFAEIIKAISDEMFRRQTAALSQALSVNQMFIETIIKGSDLNQISEILSDLLHASVMIMDTINHRCATYIAAHNKTIFDPLSDKQVEQVFITKAYYHELRIENNSFGYLFLYDRNAKVSPNDDLLTQILNIILLDISREQSIRANRKNDFSSFLIHLLTDPITDIDWDTARAENLGLNMDFAHVLIQLRIDVKNTSHENKANFQKALLINNFILMYKNLGFTCLYTNSSEDYIFLLGCEPDNPVLNRLSEHLAKNSVEFSRNYPALHIKAGCGLPHTGITGIIQSNHEASLALRVCNNSGKNILYFGELGILQLLYNDNPEQQIKTFISQTLGNLSDKSSPRNVELLTTLQAYFKYHGNIKLISQNLFTHYNTVAYRIKRIEQITHSDLHNSEDYFQLELALHLYYALEP